LPIGNTETGLFICILPPTCDQAPAGWPLTVAAYSAPGGDPPQVAISSLRCPNEKIVTLADEGAVDGRYVGQVVFRPLYSGNGCFPGDEPSSLDFAPYNVPEGEVGVHGPGTPDTITIRLIPTGASYQIQTRARAFTAELTGADSFQKMDLTTNFALGPDAAIYARLSSVNDNFLSTGRDISLMRVESGTTYPDGMPLTLVETGSDSAQFQSSFFARERSESDPQLNELAVESELPGGGGSGRPGLPTTYDWIDLWTLNDRISGNAGRTYSCTLKQAARVLDGGLCDQTIWYDGNRPTLNASPQIVGPNAEFLVEIVGDDPFTNRVFGEKHTATSGSQVEFRLGDLYVPGSEHVWDTFWDYIPEGQGNIPWVDGGAAASERSWPLLSTVVGAAEYVVDRNQDRQYICGHDINMNMSETSQEGFVCTPTSNSATTVVIDPATGVVTWTCDECNAESIGYDYRLGSFPAATGCQGIDNAVRGTSTGDQCFRQYTTLGLDRIRVWDPLSEGTCCADETFTVDYTVGWHDVVVTSSAGETETVRLRWDAQAQSYRGSIPVEVVRVPNNGKIFVSGASSTITVRFDDPHLEDGNPSPTDNQHFDAIRKQVAWLNGQDAQISFHTHDFRAVLSDTTFGPGVPVRVVDRDSDRSNQQDAVVVRAQQDGVPTNFVYVTLRETANHSGVFQGYIPMGSGAGRLDLGSGGTLVAEYIDPVGVTRTNVAVAQSVDWRPSTTGVVQLFADSQRVVPLSSAGNTVVGSDGAVYALLVDQDLNTNSALIEHVFVTVASNADPGGEVYRFTEAGFDSDVFVSPVIRFESTPTPNNGRVYARDNGIVQDDIFFVYLDRVSDAGRQEFVRSDPFKWNRTFDGVVDVEAAFYVGTQENATAGVAGIRPFSTGTVADGDCNIDPFSVERISTAGSACPAASAFRIGVLTSAGTLQNPVGVVDLVETSANSGVFMANVSFTSDVATASAAGTASAPIVLQVTNEARFRAEYDDPRPATGGEARTFLDEAQWFQAGFGIVEFGKRGYNSYEERPVVRVIDADVAGDGNISVQVTSQADATGIPLMLGEVRPGIFEGAFGLSEGPAGVGEIEVALNDELRARYQDQSPAGTRFATATIGIGNVTAPTTRIVTDPATPDGIRGAFQQPIELSFEANKPITNTFFRIGSEGSNQTFLGPIPLGEGVWNITFWSVDVFGNEEQPKSQVVVVDLSPPSATISGLAGRPAIAS
jgi:hypothetical protein